MPLPTNRTVNTTIQEHVDDHNTAHGLLNGLNGTYGTVRVPGTPMVAAPNPLVATTALEVWGHSYGAGIGTVVPGLQGWATGLAESLGLPLRNNSSSGTSLASHVGGDAAWPVILQRLTRPKRFVPPGGLYAVNYGINDLNEQGNTAPNMAGFKHALRAIVSRMRAATIFEHDDASFAYPTGSWADLASTTENSGSGYKYTTGNATFTVTTPAEFPGGTIAVGFTARVSGAGATITATVNGILYTFDAHNPQAVGYIPCVMRIPNVPLGPQTITFTVASVVSLIGVDYWQWEPGSADAAVVALLAQPKPLDYTNYGAVAPGPPTDAGVDVLNTIISAVAAEFDARVVVVSLDALNAATLPAIWSVANVHPNARGHRIIWELVRAALLSVLRVQAVPGPRQELRKAADQAVTASTTLVADSALKFYIGPNEAWVGKVTLYVASSSDTPDFKVQVNAPTGATGLWGVRGLLFVETGLVGASLDAGVAFNSPQSAIAAFAGTTQVQVDISVQAGDTPGVMQVLWAPMTSDAAAVTVKAGSHLEAWRVVAA